MNVCVGAASVRVVEEAARLQVPQIVASRSQVNTDGGYIGMTPRELVNVVRLESNGKTHVIRDHGGPLQGGFDDDGVAAFDADVEAGFDALHIDVCMLPQGYEQLKTLRELVKRYADDINIEVGGEHDDQEWLWEIIDATVDITRPTVAVADVGGYCWADKQSGNFQDIERVTQLVEQYHCIGVKIKAHNMDWYGRRKRYTSILDYWNIAPELGLLESDAWLHTLPTKAADEVLQYSLDSEKWRRWFNDDEGTDLERARCGVRYLMNDPFIGSVAELSRTAEQEHYIRGVIKDALTAG